MQKREFIQATPAVSLHFSEQKNGPDPDERNTLQHALCMGSSHVSQRTKSAGKIDGCLQPITHFLLGSLDLLDVGVRRVGVVTNPLSPSDEKQRMNIITNILCIEY